ncbi:hypothetical protein AYI68_g6141, partial [Smittium mucronatum]
MGKDFGTSPPPPPSI